MRLTKLQALIKADNEAFEKLSPAKKRVAIAKDVIAQLQTKKFKAEQGVYVRLDKELTERELKKDASEILTAAKECTVCGIGGLFVSAVCKADKLPVQEALDAYDYSRSETNFDGEKAYEYLEQFFDEQTLRNIETAFEQRDDFGGEWGADEFAEEVEDDDDRLRLIMENIVVNKGKFKVENKPVNQWVTVGFRGI